MALYRMLGLIQKKKAINGLLGRWTGRQSGLRALIVRYRARIDVGIRGAPWKR